MDDLSRLFLFFVQRKLNALAGCFRNPGYRQSIFEGLTTRVTDFDF